MSYEELELLSFEVRDFLVESVSKTGGHLASNLGAVELTIALLRSFDPPRDKVIWDVGHQSYVYKLLTGRHEQFAHLRQLDGMSGFPKTCESDYDIFDTGHASNSISFGQGLAKARDISKEKYQVVSVIGDGAMSGGMAFEALNNMVHVGSKQIIILNDNGMSISRNNGGLSAYLGRIRGTRKYTNLNKNIKQKLGRMPVVGPRVISGIHNTKQTIKFAVLEDGMIFEELGLKYFGPIDGHNIQELTDVLDLAKEVSGPVLIHICTKKGRGYSKAEENPDVFHGIGPFDPETGNVLSSSTAPSYSKVFGDKLTEMAASNDKIIAISAAMVDGTGLRGFEKKYPQRIFDMGIAEEHAVTFAAGMAKAGMKPFVAIYSTFLQRAYDQIIEDIALQKLPVVLCIDRAGVVGADGETHQGIFDISYLSSMPEMTILAPKDGQELCRMLEYAEKAEGPCAIRYPRGQAAEINDEPFDDLTSEVLTEGKDCVIWAAGSMVETALAASEILKEQDIDAGVINARCLKPLDEGMLRRAAADHDLLITLEDNVLSGGMGEHINSILKNEDIRIINIGWPDKFIEHGSVSQLRKRYGLDEESIAERIKGEL